MRLLRDVAPVPPCAMGRALVNSNESILVPPVTRSPPVVTLIPEAKVEVARPEAT